MRSFNYLKHGSRVAAIAIVACLACVAPAQAQTAEEANATEAAERALERVLVSTGALLLPAGQFEIEPGFFYVRSEQTVPVGINAGNLVLGGNVNSNFLSAAVQLRLGLPATMQLELDIPYQYVSEESVAFNGFQAVSREVGRSSGLGDVTLGLAKVLLIERGARPNLIGRLTWDTATGDNDDNLTALGGSGFNEVQLSVLVTKRQDPLLFVGGLSYQTAFEKDDQQLGDEVGLTLGVILAASPDTSLRITFDQTTVDEFEFAGVSVPGSRTVVGSLTFGASWIVGTGKLLDFTIQSGLNDSASDFAFGVSLSSRHIAPWGR